MSIYHGRSVDQQNNTVIYVSVRNPWVADRYTALACVILDCEMCVCVCVCVCVCLCVCLCVCVCVLQCQPTALLCASRSTQGG